ncbi:hypothetical protein [Mycolicibacterium sp. HK-90]|uniref:hypothetical protein n=1 Tax=Mycolicibacterium sp. HK-90 TaxID=3056937 RepID=UPI00265ADF6B|nr:hypothetical protein [Mycolicibacterium sp. HK-90]WKG05854.1 hypothetical protein QU592_12570 [Mycolicibacterium sp. HK-90]
MKPALVAAILAAVALSAASCTNQKEAASVDQKIGQMPGVSSTNLSYDSNVSSGETFRLTVNLMPDVTDAQVVRISQTFVDQIKRTGLDDESADLYLRFSSPDPPSKHPGSEQYSTASFGFGQKSVRVDPTADQVGDSAGVWLRAARAGVAQLVDLVQPLWGEGGDSRQITITLDPSTPAAKAVGLQRSDPGLAQATWEIHLPVGDVGRSHDYTSTPNPPSDPDRALWSDISAVVGEYYDAKADTAPMSDRRQALTVVEIDVPKSADSDQDLARIAREVPPLLPRFGHPTQLSLRTPDGMVELIAGGCFTHRDDHTRLPLELELSARYEKC